MDTRCAVHSQLDSHDAGLGLSPDGSPELRAIPTPTDLVFLLDISPSMYARDMSPSRLGRAEEIIQKFVVMKQPARPLRAW